MLTKHAVRLGMLAAAAMLLLPAEASAFRFGGLATQYNRDFIAERAPTLAPMGFVVLCAKKPSQCPVSTRGGHSVTLDAQRLRTLHYVNRHVNGTIVARNDGPSGGFADTWSVSVKRGDCEDFALTKRAELLRRGFPGAALRIATGRTPSGEGHAVLVVRTSKGDMVLDNRTNQIRTWNNTDLRWISIQSGSNPRLWNRI